MSLRNPLLLPAVVAAVALPAGPAFAGEDNGDPTTPPPSPTTPAPTTPAPSATPNSAKLHASQGCVSGRRTKATVTGDNIDSVAFFVDGKRVKTVSSPDSNGSFALSMSCARMSVGAHRARAVVSFAQGSSPASQTLRFQITRSVRSSARFTG